MQDNHTPTDNLIPYGYCQCGCGEKTRLAPQDCTSRGWIRGEPISFVHGHNSRMERFEPSPCYTKTCNKCEQELPASAFGKLARTPDGLNRACKICIASYYRSYFSKNKSKHAERTKAWRLNNLDAARAIKRNRRSRESAGGETVSAEQWKSVLDRFGGKCAKCGSRESVEMDHVVPLARGGLHTPENTQPLCRSCNRRKSTRIADYRSNLYKNASLPLDDVA